MKHVAPLLLVLWILGGAAARADDGPTITFLDEEAARAAIVDETTEPYFRLLQPMEMETKTGSPVPGETLEAQRQACRARYQDAVGTFSEKEQAAIRWYVEQYHDLVREHYPLYATVPWQFLKLAPPAEGGLPHTRGSSIVLPPDVVATLVAIKEWRPEGALSAIGSLLLHEQMHVVQRAHRARMERFYVKTWKLLRPASIERSAWLVEHQVVNPDSVDTRWVFTFEDGGTRRWIQPEVILSKGEGPKRMPHDFVMVALELEEMEGGFRVKTKADGVPVYANLLSFRPMQEALPGTSTLYHPGEAMADLFTKLVVHDHVLEREPSQQPMLDRYRTEFRALLADEGD